MAQTDNWIPPEARADLAAAGFGMKALPANERQQGEGLREIVGGVYQGGPIPGVPLYQVDVSGAPVGDTVLLKNSFPIDISGSNVLGSAQFSPEGFSPLALLTIEQGVKDVKDLVMALAANVQVLREQVSHLLAAQSIEEPRKRRPLGATNDGE